MSLYNEANAAIGDNVKGIFGAATGSAREVIPTINNLLNQFHDMSRGHGPQLTANVNAAPKAQAFTPAA